MSPVPMHALTAVALARLETTVSLIRREAGEYDDEGRWEEGDDEDEDIKAVVQPASPEEMADLPEGRSGKEIISLWSRTELKTVDETNGIQPDIVEWNEKQFEVFSVERWEHADYCKALASRI